MLKNICNIYSKKGILLRGTQRVLFSSGQTPSSPSGSSAGPATATATAEAAPPQQKQQQPMSTAQAASRAQAIIDLLPGSTAFSKTAYATIGTGLGAFLISKGIYVPNDETLVLIAFALTIRTLYNKLSGPLSSYLEASIAELRERWLASSITEKDRLRAMIAELESFRDHTAVTESYYSTCIENVHLQARLDALMSKNQQLQSIKAKLDEAIRKEKERVSAEKRAEAEALIASLHAALKEPKMQEAILKKCISDLEKMEARIL